MIKIDRIRKMEKEKIYINYRNLEKYLRLNAPYIFVDAAEVVPGVSSIGKKYFSNNEWFFTCHYPDNPLVPGALLLESLMETAALAIYTLENIDFVYAQKFIDFEVKHPVRPGELMTIEAKIDSFKRGIVKAHAEAYLEKNFVREERILCCSSTFQQIVPKILELNSPKKMEIKR